MQFDFFNPLYGAPILFIPFYFILIILFYLFRYLSNPNEKKPNPAPAHNNNYAILSIRFQFLFYIIYGIFYIMLFLYRYLLFVYFFKNITNPPPCIFQPSSVCRYIIIIYIQYNCDYIPAVPLLCYCYIQMMIIYRYHLSYFFQITI